MKTKLLFFSLVVTVTACNHRARYLDLNSNEYMQVTEDTVTGRWYNAKTGAPLGVYVDTKTQDTIYGFTGEVVNGKVERNDRGEWVVKADDDEYKAESANGAKIKVEGDEYKRKDGNYTIKREGDGDVKIENGRTQTKIDGKTGERKVKKDRNITDKVKKIIKD